jgi:F-type H+-transporting ATPase subunit gamma
MLKVLNGLVSRVDQDAHPLLRIPQDSGRPLLIVVTADRGLCGSFNSNVIKAAGQFILNEAPGRAITLGLVGRKGRDFFRRRGFDVRYETVGIFQKMTFADAIDIADAAIEDFTSGAASSVYLVYNEFKSVMTQRIVVERLLPIPRLEGEAERQGTEGAGPTADYLYEPAPEEIFRDLLPRHVQTQVYRALLESNAAFFAAQMTAMDAASRNSTDMIENLTLYMNKVRQAAITREIIEVVSGAAAT